MAVNCCIWVWLIFAAMLHAYVGQWHCCCLRCLPCLIHLIISVQSVCITGSSATALEEHHVLKHYMSLTVDSTGGACVENIVYAT